MQREPVSDLERFLLERIDYERTATIPYNEQDLRLDRMRELLTRLGNPHHGLKIVHVAGTKGKGSTSAMIASVLSAAGLQTGLYSSPHFDRIEERLSIGGQPCPSETFAKLVEQIRPAVTAMDADSSQRTNRPTFFEVITALAFLYFAEQRVDAAVLEVGLGGRLDSTNVCDPVVSVITSISFDHTQLLGSTLAAIAYEKAGIIKTGRPVVSGVIEPEPRDVIRRIAIERGCRLIERGTDFDCIYHSPRNLEREPAPAMVDVIDRNAASTERVDRFELSLLGEHQAANAAVAWATIQELRRAGWTIPDDAIRRGLASARSPGRIEVISRRPVAILDTAHNVASIAALVRVLNQSFEARQRRLIFATSRDKDASGMLSTLLPHFDDVVFTRYQNNPRGVPPDELARLASEMSDCACEAHEQPEAAWQAVRERSDVDDLICITGSFFLAAEIRPLLSKKAPGELPEA